MRNRMGEWCVVIRSCWRFLSAAFAVSLGMGMSGSAMADPPVTAGLTGWYEGANVTLVGGELAAWNDSAAGDGAQNWTSGGYYGGGHCPSWVNDGTGPNGQPYVFFDKAGWDWLGYDDIRDMNIRTNFTMTFVIRPQRYSETSTDAGTVFSDYGSTGNEYIGLEITADNTTWKAMVRDGSAPPVSMDVSCARAAYRDNWSIVTLHWDSGTDTLTLYQNGEAGDSQTNASFDSKTEWGARADYGEARIGRKSYYGNLPAHMGIAEMLMYDRALTDAELNQVHDYIKNRYWPPATEKAVRSEQEPAGRRPDPGVLASDGRTRYRIVLSDSAVEPEKTAAEELAAYLKKSTGAVFPVVGEGDIDAGEPGIYLGWTQFARRQGIEPENLDIDEFAVRSVGEDLVLCGSRLRGTIYAVGEFLERFCGVRWLTFYGEEVVPSRPHLKLPGVSIREKPAFAVRDIMTGGGGDRAFAFLRVNGHSTGLHWGRVPMPSAKWGGIQEHWKGPWLAHTLQQYLSPEKYFASNPEYFGMVDGRRVTDAMLCMTGEGVREAFLGILLERIAAEGDGIYNISYPEHTKQCRCEGCQALMTREGTPAAPLLDFVNYLADRIRDRHPNVMLETLAYNMTFVPPETMTVADNVVIRLAHLNRHFFEPMEAPANKSGADCWNGWRKIAKNLALWGYPSYPIFPHPNMARIYSEDLRFYKRLGVPRIFYQYGAVNDRYTHGLIDLREYLLAKLMWNPEQDTDALIEDFCRHYYGPAGPFVAQYAALVDAAYNQSDSPAAYHDQQALAREEDARLPDGVGWFRNNYRAGTYPTSLHMWMNGFVFETYRYLDLDFLTAGHELFRQAEDQVKDDQGLLARVRRARLSLDNISLRVFNRLAEDYGCAAGTLEGFPLDRDEIAWRYLDTMSRDRLGMPKNRLGVPPRSHEKAVKFIESAQKADLEKCEWLREHQPEFFEWDVEEVEMKIDGESLLLAKLAPARLCFGQVVKGTVAVRSTYERGQEGTIVYEEGRDFAVNYAEGTISRVEGSRIPDFSTNVLYGEKQFDHTQFSCGNYDFFVYVDYQTEAGRPLCVEKDQSALLPKSVAKLKAGGPFKIVAYGDSITAGGDASAVHLRYQRRYAQHLAERFPDAVIELENGATGGDTTIQGLARLEDKVLTREPDLVLVAFGMNDHSCDPAPDLFEANLTTMVTRIRERTGAEIILLSTFPPNPEWRWQTNRMYLYAAATLRAARRLKCAYADLYSVWDAVLERKDPPSLLGNNINHPNDFGHWLYFLSLKGVLF